jgi:hypothetical protein
MSGEYWQYCTQTLLQIEKRSDDGLAMCACIITNWRSDEAKMVHLRIMNLIGAKREGFLYDRPNIDSYSLWD